MIVDRYDPINLFELVPKLRLQMEPELAEGHKPTGESSEGTHPAERVPSSQGRAVQEPYPKRQEIGAQDLQDGASGHTGGG